MSRPTDRHIAVAATIAGLSVTARAACDLFSVHAGRVISEQTMRGTLNDLVSAGCGCSVTGKTDTRYTIVRLPIAAFWPASLCDGVTS